jgi:hypothetical protein
VQAGKGLARATSDQARTALLSRSINQIADLCRRVLPTQTRDILHHSNTLHPPPSLLPPRRYSPSSHLQPGADTLQHTRHPPTKPAMASARATTAAVQDVTASVAGASTSTWDRISGWASDNKVAAWTIAGVTVVVAGGSVYYLTRPAEAQESSDSASSSSEKKSAKKSKKKAAKKDVEKAAEEAVPESKPGA